MSSDQGSSRAASQPIKSDRRRAGSAPVTPAWSRRSSVEEQLRKFEERERAGSAPVILGRDSSAFTSSPDRDWGLALRDLWQKIAEEVDEDEDAISISQVCQAARAGVSRAAGGPQALQDLIASRNQPFIDAHNAAQRREREVARLNALLGQWKVKYSNRFAERMTVEQKLSFAHEGLRLSFSASFFINSQIDPLLLAFVKSASQQYFDKYRSPSLKIKMTELLRQLFER
jgi:hypothetical protein